jgi:3-oxoacyl-[acyl-carrier protein] reductase
MLVNNAGATQRGDFLTLPDELWADGFALKFFGAMRLCRAAWPYLQASGGSIVNIIGIGGRTGSAEFAIGGSVNAALMNLTKVLADRGTKDGVRVNAINPGSIATDRLTIRIKKFAAEKGLNEAEAARQMAQEAGISRFGDPEEIARAVAFLTSPQNAYIHGAILDIDGGQTRTL